MNHVKTLLVAGIAAAVWFSPAMARGPDIDVQLNFGPPAPIYEVVPPTRPGYIWAPGYWDYEGSRHIWRKGHWERERHGEHWSEGHWTEHEGRWHLDRGHWERG